MAEEKLRISPTVYAMPDDRHDNLHVEIELPGVDKENIKLRMHEDSFFVMAEKEDVKYVASYAVCCPIDFEKAHAEYKNGLLTIDVPYRTPQTRGKEIAIV